MRTHETVTDWSSDGRTVQVKTDRNQYQAAGLVITAGPWAAQLLKDLSIPLLVLRKPVFWFPVRAEYQKAIPDWPGFLYELPQGVFYGLPGMDGKTLKLAEHTGGQTIADPAQTSRDINPADQAQIERFLQQCVPAALTEFHQHDVCFYTMTPDAHFIIDRHPASPNVAFGAGFSGHGFKFTGILGQALADLVMHQSTPLPVDFLSLSRTALTQET